jgi:hypothetical protein
MTATNSTIDSGRAVTAEGHAMNNLRKPSERFRQIIEPALMDYQREPVSERLANNVARDIDHHLDWTFEYYQRVDRSRLLGATNVGDFRRQVFALCAPLRMMNDLSDAAHHRFLTVKRDPPRVVATSTAAYVTSGDTLHVDGYAQPFLPAAIEAVKFWRAWPD